MASKLVVLPTAQPLGEILPSNHFAPTLKAVERVAEFFTAQITTPHPQNIPQRHPALRRLVRGQGIEKIAIRPIHEAVFLKDCKRRSQPQPLNNILRRAGCFRLARRAAVLPIPP